MLIPKLIGDKLLHPYYTNGYKHEAFSFGDYEIDNNVLETTISFSNTVIEPHHLTLITASNICQQLTWFVVYYTYNLPAKARIVSFDGELTEEILKKDNINVRFEYNLRRTTSSHHKNNDADSIFGEAKVSFEGGKHIYHIKGIVYPAYKKDKLFEPTIVTG